MNDSAPELADAVPGAPKMGLRERKKAATIRRLQEVAIEQFEEHGFENVTIEHIAEHAEVSPSTVYRYFGTKENLVLRDEYDDQVLAIAPTLMATDNVFTAFEKAIEAAAEGHREMQLDLTWRRTKIWMETPTVRAAAYLLMDEISHQLADIVTASDGNNFDAQQAYVVCTVAVMSVVASIENWYTTGGDGDPLLMAAEAIRLIKPAWAGKP